MGPAKRRKRVFDFPWIPPPAFKSHTQGPSEGPRLRDWCWRSTHVEMLGTCGSLICVVVIYVSRRSWIYKATWESYKGLILKKYNAEVLQWPSCLKVFSWGEKCWIILLMAQKTNKTFDVERDCNVQIDHFNWKPKWLGSVGLHKQTGPPITSTAVKGHLQVATWAREKAYREREMSYLICSETCSSGLVFRVINKDLLLAVAMVITTTRVRIMIFTLNNTTFF